MRNANRYRVLTGLLVFALLPALAFAASESNGLQEIKSLELQYLSSNNSAQRNNLVNSMRALAISSPADVAEELNTAVSAMLPAANSPEEAEALLNIGAAHPARSTAAQEKAYPKDVEFLVDARTAAAEKKHASADVEELADIRIDHLGKDSAGNDWLASSHVQQVWRINTVLGAKSFVQRSLMYAAMSERLCIVRARVLKHDGREVAAAVSGDQAIVARSLAMYFDSRRRDVTFSHLEPGDVVELEYYVLPLSEVNPWGGYYAKLDMFRDCFPTQLRRRVVIAPSTMKLYTVEQGLHPAVVSETAGETTRSWELRDCGAQSQGSRSRGNKELGPYLHVSTIGSMAEFGRWYNARLAPGMKLNENLRAVADQILARNLSTLGKVQAVYEAVQQGTKYVAFEFGVHSYQPYSVSTVEKRGFGDCKDLAGMIVALLRGVGVQADFAMIRTRSQGVVAPEALSVELFNHAVAYIPELNLYLDGTAKHATVGELPQNDLGAVAMTVDANGRATLRTVPLSTAGYTFTAPASPALMTVASVK